MTDRIQELFEQSNGAFLSGEEISAKLNISRTAVWKHIDRLRKQGYLFEAAPRKGYRLVSAPEKFDLPAFAAELQTKRFGRSVKLLDEVDSTQAAALALVQTGAEEGTLVIAEQQTAGRGRLGRHWHAPKGKGLWFSLILRPTDLPLSQTPQLTLLTAVALCRAVRRATGLEAGIKWPNDLLINGKKASGILLEASAEYGSLQYVIAGIGISVNLMEEDFPPELRDKAASLAMHTGARVDRSQLLAAFMNEWEQLYILYGKEGFAPVKLLWEALTVSLGRPIICNTAQGQLEGFAESIDDQGALLVRLQDGTIRKIFSGDVDFR